MCYTSGYLGVGEGFVRRWCSDGGQRWTEVGKGVIPPGGLVQGGRAGRREAGHSLPPGSPCFLVTNYKRPQPPLKQTDSVLEDDLQRKKGVG